MHATFNWSKIQGKYKCWRRKERDTGRRTVSGAVNMLQVRTSSSFIQLRQQAFSKRRVKFASNVKSPESDAKAYTSHVKPTTVEKVISLQ